MNKDKILKIVSIVASSLVALVCIVELFALVFDKEEDDTPAPPKDPFDAFIETLTFDSLTECYYNVSYTESGITLLGEYTAEFSTVEGERSVTLSYAYDKLGAIGESDEMITKMTGNLTARGEKEISELLGKFDLPFGVFVKKDLFDNYTIEDSRLSGKLSEGSLGKDTKNITLSFEKNSESGLLKGFELTYESENGSNVSVLCELKYEN